MAESVTLTAILSAKDRMTPVMKAAGNATGGLRSKISSLVGVGAAMQVGMKGVNMAMNAVSSSMSAAVSRVDTLNQFPKLMNQMGLASEKAAEKVKGNLVEAIDGLPTSLDEIVASTKNIAILTGDLDAASDTAVALNDAFLASGSSSADASRGLTQYQQMLAKGKVDQQAWNTLTETMGYGLDKAAKSMLGNKANQKDLYAALQDGKITFDEFNKELIKLDKAEGGFAETARTASVGIATSFSNIRTAITAGLANSINALDTAMKSSGVKWLEGGIAGTLDNVKNVISKTFKKINAAIASVDIKGIVNGLTPAFKVLKTVATAAGKAVGSVLKLLNGHAEGVTKAVTAVAGLAIAYGGYRKISGIIGTLKGAGKATSTLGKGSEVASKGVNSLKGALGALAKMAGVAAIIASLALLAKAMTGLGKLGTKAIAPLVTFGAVVSGMAAVFAGLGNRLQASAKGIAVFGASVAAMAFTMSKVGETGTQGAVAMAAFGAVVAGLAGVLALAGSSLQASALGIGVFGAAVSAMAYTMSKVASTGTEGAVAMVVFGVVIAALAGIFALLGPALDVAALGMVAFGAAVLMAGIGLGAAAPFVTAMASVIRALGSAVSQVADSIGSAMSRIYEAVGIMVQKIGEGIATVVDAFSSGFSKVLDSVAGVIESVGTSAQNAGNGFRATAEGIQMIAALSLWDIGKSLTAVAVGMGKISSKGENLPAIATGMQMLITGIMSGAAGLTAFNTSLSVMAELMTTAASSITTLNSAFSGFTIPAPNAGPFIAAFSAIVAASRRIVPALTSAGKSAGSGLARGLSAGCGKAGSVVGKVISSSVASVNRLAATMRSAGSRAGSDFASGIQKGMSKATSVSQQAVNRVNQTLRSGVSGARSAGAYISQGFAAGMMSCLGSIEAAASRMVAAANRAIEAKAKIASPSKVTKELGGYYGAGWVNGIKERYKEARRAAADLVNIPNVNQPRLAFAGGSLSDEYNYSGGYRSVTVEVPVVMDGKEVARVTAPYTEAELNKRQTRADRKKGVR